MSRIPTITLLRHHVRLVRPLLLGALLLGVVAYWPLAAITLNANRSGGFLSNLLSGYSDADVRMLMVPAVLVAIWALLALALSIRLFLSPTANSPATFLLERPLASKLLWWTRLAAVVAPSAVVVAVHLAFWRVTVFVDSPHDGGVQTLIAASVVIPVCICIGVYAASICVDRSRAALVAIGLLAVGTAATMIAVEIAPLATLGSVHIVWPLVALIAFTLLRAAFTVSVRREPLGPPRPLRASRSVALIFALIALAFLPVAHAVVRAVPEPTRIFAIPVNSSAMLKHSTFDHVKDRDGYGYRSTIDLMELSTGRSLRRHQGPLDGVAVDLNRERYLVWRRFDGLGRPLPTVKVVVYSFADGLIRKFKLDRGEQLATVEFRGEQLFVRSNLRCQFVPISGGPGRALEGCDALYPPQNSFEFHFESADPLEYRIEGYLFRIENEATNPTLIKVPQSEGGADFPDRQLRCGGVINVGQFPWHLSIHEQLLDTPIPAGPNIETSFALPAPNGERLWMFDSNVEGLPEVDPFWMNDQEVGGTGPFLKGPWRMWAVDLGANSATEIPPASSEWETLPLPRTTGWLSNRYLITRDQSDLLTSQVYLLDTDDPARGWYPVK